MDKARELFLKAADGGHPYAPTNLGQMYRDGAGVPADIGKAKTWLELGAARGDYWGALDRGRIELGKPDGGAEAARWLALAVALNVNRGNNDPDRKAAHLLAGVAEPDKRSALASLQKQTGDPPGSKIATKQLDAKLVGDLGSALAQNQTEV